MNAASMSSTLSDPAQHRSAPRHRQSSSLTADGAPDVARWPVISLLIIAAVAHVPVTVEHLKEAPYMGVLFGMFTVAALLVAGALAAGATSGRYVVAAALCTAAVAAYVATRLVAFPLLSDDVGAWSEPLGLLSVGLETAVMLLAVHQTSAPAAGRGRRRV